MPPRRLCLEPDRWKIDVDTMQDSNAAFLLYLGRELQARGPTASTEMEAIVAEFKAIWMAKYHETIAAGNAAIDFLPMLTNRHSLLALNGTTDDAWGSDRCYDHFTPT
jgi:hypothetical protein